MKILKIPYVFALLCMWCSSPSAQAQQEMSRYVDAVYLKDGSLLIGKLLQYHVGQTIQLQLESGASVILEYHTVKKVVQHVEPKSIRNRTGKNGLSLDYAFREKGWNHQVLLSTLWGRGEWNTIRTGVAAEYVAGYRFSRAWGIALGSGINNYDIRSAQLILPIYVEQRGYFTDHFIAPTYSLGAGYGFAFKNERIGIDEATGGPLLNASIGVRIGALRGMNFLADLGLRYQRASYTDTFGWEPGYEWTYRYDYLRWNLRFGLTF